MTSEDDFQAALDRDPKDWQTRLVFADWLDERGDARAEGYRALGHLRLCPWTNEGHLTARSEPAPREWGWVELDAGKPYGSHLPFSWVMSLMGVERKWSRFFAGYVTRRDADDDAARAFGRLHPHFKVKYAKA